MERNSVVESTPSDTPQSKMLAGLLAGRYSCRAFKSDPVPTETIDRMLTLAQFSASWCNVQPWNTIVTSPPATDSFRKGLLQYLSDNPVPDRSDLPYPLGYFGIYNDRRRECGWQLYESVGIAQGDREASARQANENFRLFGAPHVLILTTERDLGIYGAVDCGIYLGSLLMAAQSLGIATIAQASLARCSPFLHEFFSIPETRSVICGLSFGFSDESHPANRFRTRRAPLVETASFVKNM